MADRKKKNINKFRENAEQAVKGAPQDIGKLDRKNVKDLLHELQTRQIELEIQNVKLRQAQEELEASRDQYTELYEFAPVGYLSTDEKGFILKANLTFASMLDTARKNVLGQPLSHFIAKDDVDLFCRKFKQIRKTRRFSGTELRFVRSDGSLFSAKLEAIAVKKAETENSPVHMAVVDISDQKKTEEALRESEAKFRSLYDTMNEGVCLHEIIYDQKGHAIDYRILDVNPAYESLVGLKRDKAIGYTASALYGIGKPPYLDTYAKVAVTGVPATFETYFAPLKKHFCISVFSPEQGRFATVITDITERKQTEEALKKEHEQLLTMFDGMDEVIYVIDGEKHEVLYMNGAAKKQWGDMVGCKCYKALQGMDEPCSFCTNAQIFGVNLGKTYTWEHRNKLNERWYRCIDRAIRWPDGRMVRLELAIDITNRKEAEQALVDSESRFRTLFEQAGVGFAIVEAETGKFHKVNQKICDITGYPPEELLAKTFMDITSPEDLQPDLDQAERVKKGHIAEYSMEKRCIRKDGSIVWVNITRAPMWAKGDTPNYFVAVVEDITERKEAEQALAESEAEMRSLLENSPDFIIHVDRSGKILFVNRHLPGHTIEEAIGKSIYEYVIPKYHDIHRRTIAQVFKNGKGAVLEPVEAGTADQIAWYETRIGPVMHQGKVDTVMLIARDITERKMTEVALAEESSVNRFMAGLSATILKGTSIQELSELILDAAKQFTGSKYGFVSFIDQDTGHMVSPTMTEDIWEECRVENRVNIFHEFKGLWGWVLEHGKPLMTNKPGEDGRSTGSPEGHVAIERFLSVPAVVGSKLIGQIALANADRDYTERDQFIAQRLATLYGIALQRWRWEKTLQQAKDDLERRVEERTAELKLAHDQLLHAEKLSAIGKLSASIAHEFNNPLFGVRNVLAGIKRRAALEDEDKELVKMALKECDRIKYLIQDLQDFNRPTSGVMAPMDVNKAVDSILLLLKKEYKNRKIKVEKRFAADLPKIRGVADQIKQVLLNLFSNAADAIGQRGGKITVSTQALPNQTVAIHIQDTGTGIKPEDMKYIFDPFFTTKKEVKGTGLGLSVSYGIVKRHGGRIDVLSELGKGSTFSIILAIGGPS